MFKYFVKENFALIIITVVSSFVLFIFSFITVTNYMTNMEKEYIEGCNEKSLEEVENGLSYGKTLDNYYGLDDVLARATNIVGEEKIILVVDNEGKVLGTGYPKEKFPVDVTDFNKVEQEIHDANGNVAGKMVTYFSKESITNAAKPSIVMAALGCSLILIISLVAFAFALVKSTWSQKKSLSIIIIGIILQGILCTALYSNIFRESSRKNVYGIASYLGTAFESVQEKGINVDDIEDVNEYLGKESEKYDFIQSITLTQEKLQKSDSEYIVGIKDSSVKVRFDISDWYITKKVIGMMLSFFATVILSVIVMIESIPISDLSIFRRTTMYNTRCKRQYEMSAKTLRLTNFTACTFSYMCLSFAALQIKEWNVGCWGMSAAMASAMAVSLCTLAEAAGMIILPIISGKMKKKNLLRISSILLVISNLACFFVQSTGIMLIMRVISGFAFSGNKQVNNIFITKCYETDEQKQKNLSESNAGIIGGILCGMGFGAVVSEVFGYGATFAAAGVGYFFYMLICVRFIPWKLVENDPENDTTSGKQEAVIQLKKMGKMLTSKEVWKRLIFVVTPQYFFLMIIVTLIPGRTLSAGMHGNVLTYCNLLSGIFGLYIGEMVGKFLIKKWGQHKALASIFVLGVLSIVIINVPVFPVVMIIVSAIITGLLDGAGTPLATDVFLQSKGIKAAGDEATGLMLFSTAGFVVMAIAPILLEICESNPIVMYATAVVLLVMAFVVRGTKDEEQEKANT